MPTDNTEHPAAGKFKLSALLYRISGFWVIGILLGSGLDSACFAQERLYVGLHGGWSAQFSYIYPDDPVFVNRVAFTRPVMNLGADVRLDQEATYLHLGIGAFNHVLRYDLTDARLGPRSAYLSRGFNMQFALKRRLNLWRHHLHLVPMAGFEVGNFHGMKNGYEFQAGQFYDGNDLVNTFDSREPFNRQFNFYPMGGLALEWGFDWGLVLSARTYYAQGLHKVNEGRVGYQRGGEPSHSTRFYSRYSHVLMQVGASYAVSRIWEGKI